MGTQAVGECFLSFFECDCLGILPSHFLINERAFSFFFFLLVPVQCLDKTFCTLSFAYSRKMLSKFSKPSNILKHREKLFFISSGIVTASFITYIMPDEDKNITVQYVYSHYLQLNNSCLLYLHYNSILTRTLLLNTTTYYIHTTISIEYHCHYFNGIKIHHTIQY